MSSSEVSDNFDDSFSETFSAVLSGVLEPPLASPEFFIGTPVASDFFGLTGDPDVGAVKVFTRLSAHTVYAGIAPFQAIFVAVPILLHPIGRRLAWCHSAGAASSTVNTIKNDAPPRTHHHLRCRCQ